MTKNNFSILAITVIMLIPIMPIYAQSANDNLQIEDQSFSDLIPDNTTVGPVGLVNELYEAHNTVTNIMIDTSEAIATTGFVQEEVFLEAVYVDEENMTLVLWLDPVQAFDPLEIEDIQEELNITVPIQVKYGYFIAEALISDATPCPYDSGSLACYYWDRYISRCLPDRTTSRCSTYETQIMRLGGSSVLPTLLGSAPQPRDTDGDGINDSVDQCDTQRETVNNYQDSDGCPDTVPRSPNDNTSMTIFSDDFENGLSKWVESGDNEWQAGRLDDSAIITGFTRSNQVAEADNCDDDEPCVLTLKNAINLSEKTSATLEFDRYVDRSLDRNEYLIVEIGNNDQYTQVFNWSHGSGDDSVWHHETLDLSGYLSDGFKIRFLTEQSSSGEDVGIDNVQITAQSQDECILNISAALQDDGTIDTNWNACQDIRRYKVYFSEDDGSRRFIQSVYDGTSYTYTRANEGSSYSFHIKAQSNTDYRYTDYFVSNIVNVPISDRIAPIIMVPDDITIDATSQDGIVVNFTVSAFDQVDGTIPVSCDHTGGNTFAVGATTVTCTASDAAGNDSSASFVITVNEFVDDTNSNIHQTNYCGESTIRESGLQCIIDDIFQGIFEQKIGTIYGGQVIGLQYAFTNETGVFPHILESTLTIGATTSDGTRGIVVSGHAMNPTKTNFIPETKNLSAIIEENTILITPNGFDGFNTSRYGISNADALFLPVFSNITTIENQVIKRNGDLVQIENKGGIHNGEKYPSVSILGYKTNSDGQAIYNNVTVSDPGGILTNHAISTYRSEIGDSGAPVINYINTESANLFGMHVGKLCSTFFNSTNPQTVSEKSDCTRSNLGLKIFTPWENVQSSLDLR